MIFKTIAKPEGFTLTQDEMNSVADIYKEKYLTEGMTFKHWSSNPNHDEPVTGDVVMTEDKNFFPVEQPKPVVQYNSEYSAWIGVDGTTVRLTTDTPESYFFIQINRSVHKILVGVVGMNTSESAWGGDFGVIDVDEILSSGTTEENEGSTVSKGTLSYRSNDGKRQKNLKVTASSILTNSGVSATALTFVVYNADMVAVTNSDIIEIEGTQETHMLQYRVIE